MQQQRTNPDKIYTKFSSVPAADGDAAVALVDTELLLEALGARAAGVAAGRIEAGRSRRPGLCGSATESQLVTWLLSVKRNTLLHMKVAEGHQTCQHGLVSHSSTSTQTLAPSAPKVVRYIGYGHSPHCRPPKAREQEVSASQPPLLAAQRFGPFNGTLAGASAQLSPTQLSMQRQLRGQKEWPMSEDIHSSTHC